MREMKSSFLSNVRAAENNYIDYRSDFESGTHKYFQIQERKDEISFLIISTKKTDLRLLS